MTLFCTSMNTHTHTQIHMYTDRQMDTHIDIHSLSLSPPLSLSPHLSLPLFLSLSLSLSHWLFGVKDCALLSWSNQRNTSILSLSSTKPLWFRIQIALDEYFTPWKKKELDNNNNNKKWGVIKVACSPLWVWCPPACDLTSCQGWWWSFCAGPWNPARWFPGDTRRCEEWENQQRGPTQLNKFTCASFGVPTPPPHPRCNHMH